LQVLLELSRYFAVPILLRIGRAPNFILILVVTCVGQPQV